MRILFLHEVNYLEKPIFEMHEFPEHLSALGHEIAFVQFPEGLSMEQVRALGWKKRISGRVLGKQNLTLYTPQNAPGSLLGRLLTALTFSKSFSAIAEDFRPDIIVSFAVPTSGWQALKVAKNLSIPFVFRALDVSHLIRITAFSGLIQFAERFVYRNADHVSANNLALARYCISQGASSKEVSVELPPLDLGHFSGAARFKPDMRAKFGFPQTAKVAVYMGSFFYFSGLPQVIKDFAENNTPNTYLVLIGGGEQDSELRELVSSLGMDNKVRFTGFVPYSELPMYLGVADVAINPMQPLLVSNFALPNKVLQYLASGLPVITFRLSGLKETLPPKCEIVVATREIGIWGEVIKFFEQQDAPLTPGKKSFEELEVKFSIAGTVTAMEGLLETVRGRFSE